MTAVDVAAYQMEELLRDALEADERSQQKLAEDAEIGMAQIHYFRNETRSLTLESAFKLASALGLELKAKRAIPKRSFVGTVREFLERQKKRGLVPSRRKPLVFRMSQLILAIVGIDEEQEDVIGEYWSVPYGAWKKSHSLHPDTKGEFVPLSNGGRPKFEPSPKWTGYLSE